MKNNNINKEIKEMFLREYFTFDLLLDKKLIVMPGHGDPFVLSETNNI